MLNMGVSSCRHSTESFLFFKTRARCSDSEDRPASGKLWYCSDSVDTQNEDEFSYQKDW